MNEHFNFDEMMSMFLHWDDASRGCFSQAAYDSCLAALNGLVDEFGRAWVEHAAGIRKVVEPSHIKLIGNDNCGDGADGVFRALRLYEDWGLVKKYPNAKGLKAKLARSYNDSNVDLEIHIAAGLIRAGAEIELEPALASGKRSDFRMALGDGQYLYGEVSKRTFEIEKLESNVSELLKLCLKVAPGCACSLHILGEFGAEDFELIRSWLERLRGSCVASIDLPGLAEFRAFPHGHDGLTPIILDRKPSLQFRQDHDVQTGSFATIGYYVPAFGFYSKFEEEREQLPDDQYGVIVIEVTGITGSLKHWRKQAVAALGENKNANIVGVLFVARYSDGHPPWKFDASVAMNGRFQGNKVSKTVQNLFEAMAAPRLER